MFHKYIIIYKYSDSSINSTLHLQLCFIHRTPIFKYMIPTCTKIVKFEYFNISAILVKKIKNILNGNLLWFLAETT